MAKKKTLTGAYDALPKLAKLLIQLILGAIVGGVYRIVRFFETGKLLTLVVGILVTFTGVGNLIAWIVDLVTVLLNDKITVFAD